MTCCIDGFVFVYIYRRNHAASPPVRKMCLYPNLPADPYTYIGENIIIIYSSKTFELLIILKKAHYVILFIKELGPRTAKWCLFHVKIVKHEIVYFLLHK